LKKHQVEIDMMQSTCGNSKVYTLALLIQCLAWLHCSVAQDDPPVHPVRVGKVMMRDAAAGRTFVGTIEPARRSVVGAAVAGKVDQVFVEEGDLVDVRPQAGGPPAGRLIQLRLNAVNIALAAAEAELDVTRQNLAELMAGTRPEELKRLQAAVSGAAALHDYTAKRFGQIQTLFDRSATDQGNLDQALSARHAAEQTWIAARAEHEAAINGARPEALARARALQAVAREEVNRLQDEIENHTVRTPFRGYVARRYVENGAWVSEGAPVAEIIDLDWVEVRVAVPEEDVLRVRPGMAARVDVPAIQSEISQSAVLTGVVFRIVPDADSRSRSFPVRIRIQNQQRDELPLLKPGMLARVVLLVGDNRGTILVPKDAIVLDGQTASVFVVERNQTTVTVREVAVESGGAEDLFIHVRPLAGAELAAGMQVVTEGNERLSTGDMVQVQSASK
jgi:HlyD family secretion protein